MSLGNNDKRILNMGLKNPGWFRVEYRADNMKSVKKLVSLGLLERREDRGDMFKLINGNFVSGADSDSVTQEKIKKIEALLVA
jgi:hypothetical protein